MLFSVDVVPFIVFPVSSIVPMKPRVCTVLLQIGLMILVILSPLQAFATLDWADYAHFSVVRKQYHSLISH